MTKPPVKFQNNRHKTVGEVAPEKWLSSKCEKSDNINLRIISNPHAHLQTMTKTPVKFSKDRHKSVEGVAHKMYLLL